MISEKLLSASSVAKLLDTSERSIWRWVSAGRIIKPIRLGAGTTRWRQSEIMKWIDAGCPAADEYERTR
jgi:predicted DNA-binding transcriptional regulator AlpA